MVTRAGYLTTRLGGYLHREVPDEDAELGRRLADGYLKDPPLSAQKKSEATAVG